MVKMKLKENCYDTLSVELEKSDGPFSKTSNVMLAFDLMEKGELMSSNQVTKVNLINLIKVLCSKLELAEENEEEQEAENEVTENSDKNEEKVSKSIPSNAQNVTQNSQEICKFYRVGKCIHGKSVKTPEKTGKICAYNHPQTCRKFELFGNKRKRVQN